MNIKQIVKAGGIIAGTLFTLSQCIGNGMPQFGQSENAPKPAATKLPNTAQIDMTDATAQPTAPTPIQEVQRSKVPIVGNFGPVFINNFAVSYDGHVLRITDNAGKNRAFTAKGFKRKKQFYESASNGGSIMINDPDTSNLSAYIVVSGRGVVITITFDDNGLKVTNGNPMK